MVSLWHLDDLYDALTEEPDISHDLDHVHILPSNKLFYAQMGRTQRYVHPLLTFDHNLTFYSRDFLRNHWPEFQYLVYYPFRGFFDIKATFADPHMNRYGEELFVRHVDMVYFYCIRQNTFQKRLAQNYPNPAIRGLSVAGGKRKGFFWDEMVAFAERYNLSVTRSPALGLAYAPVFLFPSMMI